MTAVYTEEEFQAMGFTPWVTPEFTQERFFHDRGGFSHDEYIFLLYALSWFALQIGDCYGGEA